MILIRVFKTEREAYAAKKVLDAGGFKTSVVQDKLYQVPIERYGVPARWRLLIKDEEFVDATKFLAEKLKKH